MERNIPYMEQYRSVFYTVPPASFISKKVLITAENTDLHGIITLPDMPVWYIPLYAYGQTAGARS